MNAEAAVFVPGGAAVTDVSADDNVNYASRMNESLQGWSGFSTETPEFIPGGSAWQAAEYSAADTEAEACGYMDQDQFLTPQIFPDEDRRIEEDDQENRKCVAEVDAENEETAEDVDSTVAGSSNRGGSSGSSCGRNSCSTVGSLRIDGHRLHWHIHSGNTGPEESENSGCVSASSENGRLPRNLALHEVAKGECLKSQRFWVAGASLQIGFFPAGEPLTGEGHCAVAVFSEEKTKLKFEVVLNGKSSGSKVLLGQRFSCDFKKQDLTDAQVTVSLEVYANLLCGFY
eukprot:TRINITY_DN24003_c1_g1_i1.p1 TRINITY_DN24003_c1_g1~~TRINITY_DN24003_c1_g1_i1.p1  ORF type:complete len:287 (+),score=66.96 TRINITY_DN24003_c1_g1_i1:156-1016(+)